MISSTGNDRSFRDVLDHLNDAVFVLEWTDQGKPARCVETNARACQLLGYTRDELLTLPCEALYPPEYREGYQRLFHTSTLENRLPFQTELISKTGQRIPVELTTHLSTWDGVPVIICVVRDITTYRQIENELRYRLELERLIANISTQLTIAAPLDFEATTRRILQQIGEFLAVDRCYLTILVEGTHIIESSLDWSAPEIQPAATRYNGINIDQFAWTMSHFARNQIVRVDDITNLPPEANPEREIWSQTNIQSLVAIPIFLEGALAAYLGFNVEHQPIERQWSDTDFRLLQVMADLLGSALMRKRYAERQLAWNQMLEKTIAERTAQLHESEAKYRALAHRVVLAQEQERRHISRELHDEAGQSLNVLKIRLNLLREELVGEDYRSVRSALDDALNLTDHILQSIHDLAQVLRPAGLDTVGLHLSLDALCREFARQTRLTVTYTGEPIIGLSDTAVIVLYRFLQEALTNVLKHAQAQHVEVRLEHDAHGVVLTVCDDGCGFDVPTILDTSEGLGLRGMRERLDILGGNLTIESRIGQGTCLTARVPWEGNDDSGHSSR